MTAESCDKTGVARNSATGGRRVRGRWARRSRGMMSARRCAPIRAPVLDHARGSSRWQGLPLTTAGAVELPGRPRALAVGWGHERLVGCRASSPAIRQTRTPRRLRTSNNVSSPTRRDRIVSVSCGIDWAENHHDVALVDADGRVVAKHRISDDVAGFAQLLQLLSAAGDSAEDPIPVAIETSRGLLVACLRATGRQIYAVNPKAVDRYRDRHSVARRIRRRRRARTGPYPAHRPRRPPTAARRFRAGPGHRGARPCPTGPLVGPSLGRRAMIKMTVADHLLAWG